MTADEFSAWNPSNLYLEPVTEAKAKRFGKWESKMNLCKGFAVGAMCVGMLSAVATAAGPAQRSVSKVGNVKLAKGGMLIGRVLNSQGKAEAGSIVELRYQGRPIARTRTDVQGRYAIKNVRGGVHEVATANGRQVYRLWTERTAPPAARSEALFVNQNEVVRGQAGVGPDLISLAVLGLSGTSTYYAVKNEEDIDDLQKQNNALQEAVNNLPKS